MESYPDWDWFSNSDFNLIKEETKTFSHGLLMCLTLWF